MERRDFLKRAGVGSIALSFPFAGNAWAAAGTARDDKGGRGYHFLVLSGVSGTPDRLVISGAGRFNDTRATGGGVFDHFQGVGSPPFPVVGSGVWRARRVQSFSPLGQHGVLEGGILVMTATFFPVGKKPVRDVRVEVYCNLAPAGTSTVKPEGVLVSFPGGPVFAPVSPTVGVTAFSAARGGDD